MAISIGDIVGDYRVINVIGAGGMGAVYKVEHRITRRVEAMKALLTGIGISDEDVRRFEREIQAQARLQHPNIAAVYTAARHGDVLALVMEYVEGESLRRLLDRGPLPLAAARSIAADILAALDCAHGNGIVHGDVSPANVMITPSGSAKLTDFGLARDGSAERLADSGVPLGTAWYMSPEQVRGVAIDARSDIYAAGAVLYEMLTGRKLFEAEAAFEILRAQVETIPEPPSVFNPSVPPGLDRVVLQALAKQPEARMQTAAEFRDGLLRIAVGGRPRWRAAFAVAAAATFIACGAALVRSNGSHAVTVAPPVRAVVPPPPEAPPPQPPPPVVEPPVEIPPAPVQAPKRVAPAKAVPRKSAVLTPSAPRAASVQRSPIVALPEPPVPGAPSSAPPAGLAALPVPHPAAAAIPAPAAEEPKPEKQGNRFVKALGKINPFRRGGKADK